MNNFSETPIRKQTLPIVFIHIGNNEYLTYTLAQAKISNPDTKVYLIGDPSNDHFDFIEHHDLENYCMESELFSMIYRHHSTNPPWIELFCFQRWFILKEFMSQNRIERCLYLDSDIMLFTDIYEEIEKLTAYDFTLSHDWSPGFNFINSNNRLKHFCNFVTQCFNSPSLYNTLVETAKQQPWSQECLSDMVAFYEYKKRNPEKIGDISIIFDQNKYDSNINLSEGFEMEGNTKKIYWTNNKPFCKHLDSNVLVMFNSLHLQGGVAKHLTKDYFRGELHFCENIRKWSLKKPPADSQ